MNETPERESGSALDELAQDASSRKRFLSMVGGAGAAGALTTLLAACGGGDDEKSAQTSQEKKTGGSKGDLEIVNYALTLEYLEADFYDEVLKSGVVKDKKIAEMAKRIGQNEHEHVDALVATAKKLGTPAKKPKTNFKSVLNGGPEKVLQTAATVENLGAAAYLGQAGRIKSKEILAAALSIHSIEGRHAAALNQLVGKTIVPDGAFAKPATMEEVLPKVKPFLAS